MSNSRVVNPFLDQDDTDLDAPTKPLNWREKIKRWFGIAFDYATEALGFGNGARILASETDGVLQNTINRTFLPKSFGYTSLIYFPRLFIDGGRVLWETTHPKNDKEKAMTFWQRLKYNLYQKDEIGVRDRASRMANDAIWAPINLACLLVAPPIVIGLAAFGVTFDVIHQCVLFSRDIKHYKEMEKMKDHLQELKADKAPLTEIHQAEKAIADHKLKYGLADSKSDVIKSATGALGLTLLFSVGCVLSVCPPPINLVGYVMLGISIVLGAERLISSLWNFFAKFKRNKPNKKNAGHGEEIELKDANKLEAKPKPEPALSSTAQLMQKTGVDVNAEKATVNANAANDQAYDPLTKFAREREAAEVKSVHAKNVQATKAERLEQMEAKIAQVGMRR